jgi:hypothetical protein
MTTHELKCLRAPFQAVIDGTKRHEVRRADRDFKVGDLVELREWVTAPLGGGSYTGRSARVRITYVTECGTWGLPQDICVLSIERITPGHRLTLARARAGLSIGQAAKLLGRDRAELEYAEGSTLNLFCGRFGCPGGQLHAHDPGDQAWPSAERLAELYAVNVPWLTGDVPLRDYDAMKGVRGYDKLPDHDRDVVAEFAASLPRNSRTPSERLDRVHRLKGPGRR